MQQSQVIVTVFLFAMLALFSCVACSKDVSTPPLCEPGILEEMPQHIRKVCVALENSNQLSNALNAYIRNEAAGKNLFNFLRIFHFFSCVKKIHSGNLFV